MFNDIQLIYYIRCFSIIKLQPFFLKKKYFWTKKIKIKLQIFWKVTKKKLLKFTLLEHLKKFQRGTQKTKIFIKLRKGIFNFLDRSNLWSGIHSQNKFLEVFYSPKITLLCTIRTVLFTQFSSCFFFPQKSQNIRFFLVRMPRRNVICMLLINT